MLLLAMHFAQAFLQLQDKALPILHKSGQCSLVILNKFFLFHISCEAQFLTGQSSGKILLKGWLITPNNQEHLDIKCHIIKLQDDSDTVDLLIIPICPRSIYSDILYAMEKYADDLEYEEKLVENFIRGFRHK